MVELKSDKKDSFDNLQWLDCRLHNNSWIIAISSLGFFTTLQSILLNPNSVVLGPHPKIFL